MRFVPGGPDIPSKCLAAQQDDKLVFFCGAGVSSPSGLPLFKGLLNGIICDLYLAGQAPDSSEPNAFENALPDELLKSAYGKNDFDHLFGLLERQFDKTYVRSLVQNTYRPLLSRT